MIGLQRQGGVSGVIDIMGTRSFNRTGANSRTRQGHHEQPATACLFIIAIGRPIGRCT